MSGRYQEKMAVVAAVVVVVAVTEILAAVVVAWAGEEGMGRSECRSLGSQCQNHKSDTLRPDPHHRNNRPVQHTHRGAHL